MKRVISLLLVVLLMFSLIGCGEPPKAKKFSVPDYNLTFTATDEWTEDMEDTDLDYCCTDGSAYMGIFGFFKYDYLDDAKDILKKQSDNNIELFDKSKSLSYKPKFTSTDKEITAILNEIESDGVKIYQYNYHIVFNDKEEFFWVSYTASPSYAEKHIADFEKIIESFTVTSTEEA